MLDVGCISSQGFKTIDGSSRLILRWSELSYSQFRKERLRASDLGPPGNQATVLRDEIMQLFLEFLLIESLSK